MKAKIKINLVKEVLRLADLAQNIESDVMLKHGSYTVDATSILGIMSLNLSEPVELIVVEKNINESSLLYKQLQDEGFNITIEE